MESSFFDGNVAVYAIAEQGSMTALELGRTLPQSDVFILRKFCHLPSCSDVVTFYDTGEFTSLVEKNWSEFDAHVFIMATGIVVRKISGLLEHKSKDPAVVVCDGPGQFAISLLSGHIGGGNRLTHKVADILKATPVITTATDTMKLMAFDEMAAIQGWRVTNTEAIKLLNAGLLETKKIGVVIPEELYEKYYADKWNITWFESATELPNDLDAAVVLDDIIHTQSQFPVLYLDSRDDS